MYHLRRLTIVAAFVAVLVFVLWFVPQVLNPTPPSPEERERDKEWVDTSPYWLDRQACIWLTLCGAHHVKWDPPALPKNRTDDDGHDLRWADLRKRQIWLGEDGDEAQHGASARQIPGVENRRRRRNTKGGGAKILQEIPQYVLDHAPLVHLYSGENFWPSDIIDHIQYMTPYVNGSALNLTEPLGLGNLASLNSHSDEVFLTSNEDVETRPEWLHSHANIPSPFESEPANDDVPHEGEWGWRDDTSRSEGTTWWDTDQGHPVHRISDPRNTGRKHSSLSPRQHFGPEAQHPIVSPASTYKPTAEGYSKAPATLIIVDKGSGIVDAFWMFFYSYNLGQTVAHIRFGNHVGDWEHCMMRFENGVPRGMFLSEHSGGKAYAWQAMEKRQTKKGKPLRPVIYSAVGSHAMYATPGNHPYVLPFGTLKDVTDRGPLWDPSLNTYSYFYDYVVDREDQAAGRAPTSLTPTASNPKAPTSWFHFIGWWGDETYELRDKRQWRLFGQYHYTTGPTGPKDKQLDRHKICQTEKCLIMFSLADGSKSAWY